MPRFSGKKPYQLEYYNRRVGEIRNLLRVLETHNGFEETKNRPRMDMYETDDRFVLEFDLPGFRVEDISLRVCGVTIVLEAYRPRDQNGIRFICMERGYGNFRYVVQLPTDSNPGLITAEYRMGVLRMICPKSDGVQVPIKEITP